LRRSAWPPRVRQNLGYLAERNDDESFPYPTIDEARRAASADPPPGAIAPRSLREPT